MLLMLTLDTIVMNDCAIIVVFLYYFFALQLRLFSSGLMVENSLSVALVVKIHNMASLMT